MLSLSPGINITATENDGAGDPDAAGETEIAQTEPGMKLTLSGSEFKLN